MVPVLCSQDDGFEVRMNDEKLGEAAAVVDLIFLLGGDEKQREENMEKESRC